MSNILLGVGLFLLFPSMLGMLFGLSAGERRTRAYLRVGGLYCLIGTFTCFAVAFGLAELQAHALSFMSLVVLVCIYWAVDTLRQARREWQAYKDGH
jgi:hypothetical protein